MRYRLTILQQAEKKGSNVARVFFASLVIFIIIGFAGYENGFALIKNQKEKKYADFPASASQAVKTGRFVHETPVPVIPISTQSPEIIEDIAPIRQPAPLAPALKEAGDTLSNRDEPGADLPVKDEPVSVSDEELLSLVEITENKQAVDKPNPGNEAGTNTEVQYYTLQVASFKKEESAVSAGEDLKGKGFETYIESGMIVGSEWFRVKTGRFVSRTQAEEAARLLSQATGNIPLVIHVTQ